MDKQNNKDNEYWQDVDCKQLSKEHLSSEFGENELSFDIGSIKKTRRSFLSVMGFSFTALPLVSSCMKIPVKKALPYLEKSDQVVPGVPNWYATAMDPIYGEALLVKTREGRPIKIEGNPSSPLTKGGTMPGSQASVLSLYDSHRFKSPLVAGQPNDWNTVISKLKLELAATTEPVYLVSRTLTSPSSIALIETIKNKYSNLKHIVYEATSMSSILQANQAMFATATYPHFNMDQAKFVVSFSADFLSTWMSPVELTKQYTSARDLIENDTMLKHVHFESIMTLTGSNADERFTVTPKEERDFIISLLARVQKLAGTQVLPAGEKLAATNSKLVEKIAADLWSNRGQSLVLSGADDQHVQILVNTINYLLGNYEKTIHLSDGLYFKGPDDQLFEDFIAQMSSGNVAAAFFWDVNPVYSYFDSEKFKNALAKVKVKVTFASAPDETAAICSHVLPASHFLEAWNDYYRSPGVLTYAQPVIRSLFNSQSVQDSLMQLFDIEGGYYKLMRKTASSEFMRRQDKFITVDGFFKNLIHNGVAQLINSAPTTARANLSPVTNAYAKLVRIPANKDFTFISYQKTALKTGEMINNPWLQELPDPITKVTWDNYFMLSPKQATELGIKTGDVIEVTISGVKASLPALAQPGVAYGVVAMAIGYGRSVTGKVGKAVGANAYPFYQFNETYRGSGGNATISKTLKKRPLALTQTHHSMEGRDIVRETTLKEWSKNPAAGSKPSVKLISMWSDHSKKGQQWAMAIDLNKCTGCSGCIVSCNAENNVPVVGREEVKNRREMHWLRIDRYYKGDDNQPEVVHQPMMCQHCDNAPCETVCPVLATVQSSDGLNQQVYNRCVGTRYCANNCPYKVRRFNWFDYPHEDPMAKMVLNPDVVVRSRGVMEKCSMCIQRIQEGRLTAKRDGKEMVDGDVKLACQQSCPGDAIVFGDLNDPKSKIAKLLKNERTYRVLEELNIGPRVSYMNKVRNK